MPLAAFIFGPVAAAALAWFLPRPGARQAVLVATAVAHLAASFALWHDPAAASAGVFLAADSIGTLMLLVTSALFLASALYSVGYLRASPPASSPARVYAPALLLFLAAMDLVLLSRHFGLMWVGVEATTLATAPLVHHHRNPRSLEATWRYLMLCSVGIALALLGTFALGLAVGPAAEGLAALELGSLLERGPDLDPAWLKIAFILLLVGYGTKMGLAPFHTWLPDAHSETPAPVSALLSGALLNGAFVAVLRGYQVCAGAGHGKFAGDLLLGLGLLSLLVAAVFIVGQQDYKRMLAFSSVEHMGVMAIGIGLGGVGLYGSLLHALNHSVAKALLFLTAGNILAGYRSQRAGEVRGLLHAAPLQGALLLCGTFAVSGLPPFGTFFSELVILQAGLASPRPLVIVPVLFLLVVVAVGMAAVLLPMVHGRPRAAVAPVRGVWRLGVPALLLAAAVGLGVWIPAPLQRLLEEAARSLAR